MPSPPPDRPPRVVVVRHGETAWSRAGRHTGRSDLPLTESGREQATGLAAALGGWRFAVVLTSPLLRARDTCDLAGFGAAAALDPDLVEWDYGDYEGLTTGEIRAERPGWSLFVDGTSGGESLEEVATRAARVLARIGDAAGDVLLFAHGHILRVLTALWLEMPPAAAQRFALRAAQPSVLGHEHDWPALLSWNRLTEG